MAFEWYANVRMGLNLLESKSIGTLIIIDPDGSIVWVMGSVPVIVVAILKSRVWLRECYNLNWVFYTYYYEPNAPMPQGQPSSYFSHHCHQALSLWWFEIFLEVCQFDLDSSHFRVKTTGGHPARVRPAATGTHAYGDIHSWWSPICLWTGRRRRGVRQARMKIP